MRKGVKIKQHQITECGAVCLASVLSYYGLHFPISRIKQYCSTDLRGTNVLGLVEAASKMGLSAKGVKATFESLFRVPIPAIAHLIIENDLHHYVVIYKMNRSTVLYMDPADGEFHKMLHDEFKKIWSGVLVIVMPEETFEPGDKKEPILLKFFRLVKPHRADLIQAFFGSIIFSLLGLSTSIFVQKVVDFVLTDGNIELLDLMSLIMVTLIFLRVYLGSQKNMFLNKSGQRIEASLILGYYKHLLTLPQQYFDTIRSGEIISRMNDAVKIRLLINNTMLDVVVNLLTAIITLGIMFLYSFKLALIVFLYLPIFYIVYYFTDRENKKHLRKNMEVGAELESHMVESINNMSTIKQFGLESYSLLKTEIRFITYLKGGFKSIVGNMLSARITMLITSLLTVLVLRFGAVLVINHELTVGELMLFFSLIGFFVVQLTWLIQANENIQNALIAADRLFQILDLEQESDSSGKFHFTPELIGTIKLKNVTFRYGTRQDIFQNFSLDIQAGKMTAIVGESGSGKSTLVKLLQNSYSLQSGFIEIGNYNIMHVSSESLKRLISVVPQKIDLFAGTITENIAPGEFEPDMKRIVELSKDLNILPFIERLPQGFNTLLGENGSSISGGERQRVAIARALYRNPEILILDEATSSLDSETEEQVQRAINYLLEKKKTIIVIAHRLSTIARADQIVVIQNGKLLEQGNHHQLLEKNGKYALLWNKQNTVIH